MYVNSNVIVCAWVLCNVDFFLIFFFWGGGGGGRCVCMHLIISGSVCPGVYIYVCVCSA